MQDLAKQEAECIAYLRDLHKPSTQKAYPREVLANEIKRVTAILNEILALKHKSWVEVSSERRST